MIFRELLVLVCFTSAVTKPRPTNDATGIDTPSCQKVAMSFMVCGRKRTSSALADADKLLREGHVP